MKRQTFRNVVDDHQDRLFSAAVYILGNTAEAEEVVQEVFIKLWQQKQTLKDTHLRAWLLKVTRNACLDLIRKRVHQRNYAVAAGAQSNVLTLYTEAEAAELGDDLQQMINGLKEPYRSLIVMREVEGYRYNEIGQALDLSEQQVKVYLYRARRQLREKLEQTL